MSNGVDKFKSDLEVDGESYSIYDLNKVESLGIAGISELPYSIRVLVENMLCQMDRGRLEPQQLEKFSDWDGTTPGELEIPFNPTRVLMQDFTGVPAVVDLAALRTEMEVNAADPTAVDPLVPADLVIDHSVQVDRFGTSDACEFNRRREFERNEERYSLLRWGQSAFENLSVVPPGQGIIHQVNLEYLATLVRESEAGGQKFLRPDTVLGTDSHTTMINGLGVLGWGVGGIEAEAVMVGEPFFMLVPEVVGVRLDGELPAESSATDLVLEVTSRLREQGVVGKFVEYFGPGADDLSLPDRAVVSNMTPEYGATAGYFPVDDKSLDFLGQTGRDRNTVEKAERYCRHQNLIKEADADAPAYSSVLEFDMSEVEPAVAGPTLPHQHISLNDLDSEFEKTLETSAVDTGDTTSVEIDGEDYGLQPGALVIAALASCTNTSNPGLMVAAGMVARNAVERGLEVPGYVKTSLAPGSRVVTGYLEDLDLLEPLAELNFDLVGYGCTSCIGNSGPLHDEVVEAVEKEGLFATSVICGNRNFEGRISALTSANYLVSPPLVVAFALAGNVNVNLENEPIATDPAGEPVYLADLMPSKNEVAEALETTIKPELFEQEYADVLAGGQLWDRLSTGEGEVYDWEEDSTYIKCPPFVEGVDESVESPEDIVEARCLAKLGDSITTDHISPAGDIPEDSPAARYLKENGVPPEQFNTYGSRRGNHEVMVRGTFGNVRLENELVDKTGWYTEYLPDGEATTIYEASQRYRRKDVPLVVIAGDQYGTGSSRDWAAKGTDLLGVRAVIAEGYERIHRSNLIGMGVLPLQFKPSESRETIGLTGREKYTIRGLNSFEPGGKLNVEVRAGDGSQFEFEVRNRVDTQVELEYYRHGGILPYVLRKYLAAQEG